MRINPCLSLTHLTEEILTPKVERAINILGIILVFTNFDEPWIFHLLPKDISL